MQRGDPEMEQKLHRFIRSCIECGRSNPILSIHDQGAGGNDMFCVYIFIHLFQSGSVLIVKLFFLN